MGVEGRTRRPAGPNPLSSPPVSSRLSSDLIRLICHKLDLESIGMEEKPNSIVLSSTTIKPPGFRFLTLQDIKVGLKSSAYR